MDGSRTNIILVLGSITKVDRSLRESSKPTYLGKLSDPLRQYPSMDVTGRIEFQNSRQPIKSPDSAVSCRRRDPHVGLLDPLLWSTRPSSVRK